jgi:serine/threonine protein kinase
VDLFKTCPECHLKYPEHVERCIVDGRELGSPDLDRALLAAGFRRVRLLGSGRLGPVWEATRAKSGRCALRILREQLWQQAGSPEVFLDAARSAAALAHPNVVEIVQVGELDEKVPFVAMELMQCETLAMTLQQGPLALVRALMVSTKVARALAWAHDRGVAHGDLRPENVFVGPDRAVKVSDFAIVRALPDLPGPEHLLLVSARRAFGTPYYPACHLEPCCSPSADAYALGVLAFRLVSGRLPYDADDGLTQNLQRESGPVPRLGEVCASPSPELDRLVSELMAKDPAARPSVQDALLVLEALAASAAFGWGT